MKRICGPVLGLIGSLISYVTSYAQSPEMKMEKGVPLQLADHRQKVLHNVLYTLHFSIPAERQEKIGASETISFDLKDKNIPLYLDFRESKDHLKKIVVNARQIPVHLENEHIIIPPKHLVQGTNKIEIDFIAGELSLNRNNEFLYTLLVPDRARTVFPCFDQPNLKAKYKLSLTIPAWWKAISNAPLQDSITNGSRIQLNYKESDLFSTYLFSFAAGKFETETKKPDGREMNFLYRETDSNKIRFSMDTIFDLHAASLRFLEDYTQIKYPFQKFDFIAIPDFQYGGMEHVGAIDYKASTLFLDSGATKDQENSRANLIAHETAHMWFGDLVTMEWFNDVWMKEVFANFMADKINRTAQSGSNYELKFLLTHLPSAYSIDRTAGANPIRQELKNLQEAGTLYGPIIYNKAPVMMRQLERLMGEEAFRDGIREYLKKYAYGNASWPDLITILDKRTPVDLKSWNQVWVNTPGRPLLSYSLEHKDNLITKFVIRQKGERSTGYQLPQLFEIALVYADRVEQYTVDMKKPEVQLQPVKGREMPLYVLFNSTGHGYGLFPLDQSMQHPEELQDPVMRASAYINLYENMLAGKKPVADLTALYLSLLAKEKEELNLNLITGQLSGMYWNLMGPVERKRKAQQFENILWNAIKEESSPNKKKVLFRTFQNVAISKTALDTLYSVWKNQKAPEGVKLSEDDYTSLALSLAVKDHREGILDEQLQRITNPDRRGRLQFLMPALSGDVMVRDAFFASLKDQQVRKKEAWVADALGYLHHPLRTATSEKYLKESLDMLQEIQLTGDIFFPAAWLNATFRSYQTKSAADVVRKFLKDHPDYPPKLKAKILQAVDPVFRAERLVKVKREM